jgi:zinc finger protein
VLLGLFAGIPHFKEIVLMAFTCDHCGYKNNEVKAGGSVSEKGRRIAVRLENFPLDLNRDILKSQTALLAVPELNFELAAGTLGGKFTTVEGILQSAKDQLLATTMAGDSVQTGERNRWASFFEELDKVWSRPSILMQYV